MRTLIVVMILCASCGGAAELCDPVGTWKTTITYGDGSCTLTGMAMDTFVVTRQGPTEFVITDEDPSAQVSGSILESDAGCKLSMTEQKAVNATTTATLALNLLEKDGMTAGSGQVGFVTATSSCSQTFTAEGTKE